MDLEQILTKLGLSDLQFALAVIGLLLLLLVVILNLKYARDRRKRQAQSQADLKKIHADFTIEGRAEPTFGEQASPLVESSEAFSIDPRIDCVITLRFDEVIGGAEILNEMASWRGAASSSLTRWIAEGLNGGVDSNGDWASITPDDVYSEIQLAIQLASRRGPVNVIELSDFCSLAQSLAENLGAQIDMPSVNTMLDSAKDLDLIAAESDIQLSINILFANSYSRDDFDALMRKRGFQISPNGTRYDFSSNGIIIFNSAQSESNKLISQLTLLLDVPLVPQEERAFERMLGEGVEIAQATQGRLVDDSGINLTEAAVISIRQHLDGLFANLDRNGIPAGSSAAKRLFS